jgi:hypothetical protein
MGDEQRKTCKRFGRKSTDCFRFESAENEDEKVVYDERELSRAAHGKADGVGEDM